MTPPPLATADAVSLTPITTAGFDRLARRVYQCPGRIAQVRKLINAKSVVGFAASVGGTPVGCVAIQYAGDRSIKEGMVVLRELTIHPDHRRRRHGTRILWKLATTKVGPCYPYFTVTVHECNLAAQRWLRSSGFPFQRVIRGYFGREPVPCDDGGFAMIERDGYRFQLRREF